MDAWYRNELGYCVQAGIITGRPDGNFAPMESIDRGELAAMAARFLELANSGSQVHLQTCQLLIGPTATLLN